MRMTLLALTALFTVLGCASTALPPEAYGVFVERNNQAFNTRLEVRADGVTLFVGVALPGMRGGSPLVCHGPSSGGIQRTMNLPLTCAGESIPYEFEYRPATGDWVISEDGAAPQILERQ